MRLPGFAPARKSLFRKSPIWSVSKSWCWGQVSSKMDVTASSYDCFKFWSIFYKDGCYFSAGCYIIRSPSSSYHHHFIIVISSSYHHHIIIIIIITSSFARGIFFRQKNLHQKNLPSPEEASFIRRIFLRRKKLPSSGDSSFVMRVSLRQQNHPSPVESYFASRIILRHDNQNVRKTFEMCVKRLKCM